MFRLIDNSLSSGPGALGLGQQNQAASGEKLSFSETLSSALRSVNASQHEAEAATALLATGDIQDVHQVTVAAEKAHIALQLTISIRNQVIDAYQEISRMQI